MRGVLSAHDGVLCVSLVCLHVVILPCLRASFLVCILPCPPVCALLVLVLYMCVLSLEAVISGFS